MEGKLSAVRLLALPSMQRQCPSMIKRSSISSSSSQDAHTNTHTQTAIRVNRILSLSLSLSLSLVPFPLFALVLFSSPSSVICSGAHRPDHSFPADRTRESRRSLFFRDCFPNRNRLHSTLSLSALFR